jgi:hypothetical protein
MIEKTADNSINVYDEKGKDTATKKEKSKKSLQIVLIFQRDHPL